jgi:hypothetical protein
MKRNAARGVVQVFGIGVALAACNNPAMPTDANHMGVDSGVDGGSGSSAPRLPPAQAMGAAGALTCVGTSTEPTAGADVTATLDLIAFGQHGDRAANTHVCFCPDNVIPMAVLSPDFTSCGACQDVMTDSMGHASVMARANGWYGYRVFGHMGATTGTTFLDSIQVNEPAPAASGGTIQSNAVTLLTENLILAAQLLDLVPGTTTIAGRIQDCGENDLSHLVVRAFHANGDEIIAGDQTTSERMAYFDGDENPDANATYTGTDGLYVVVNIRTMPAELIRVEAWGYTGSSTTCTSDDMCPGSTCDYDASSGLGSMLCRGEAVRLGCEAVNAFPDGVSIVNIGPMRNDYPATNPCHGM